MGTVYFPGCKFENLWPNSNAQLKEAVFERGWADRTTGCCKDEQLDVSADERVLCVCPSCIALLRRRLPNNEIVSVWSLIEQDDTFPLPDYHGKQLPVHNCEIFRDTGTSEAVHGIANRMNLELIDYPNDNVRIAVPDHDEMMDMGGGGRLGEPPHGGRGGRPDEPPHGGHPGGFPDGGRGGRPGEPPDGGRPPHMSFLGHFDQNSMPKHPGGFGGPGGHGPVRPGGSGEPGGRGPGGHGEPGGSGGRGFGEPGGRGGFGNPGGRGPGGRPGEPGGMLDMMPQADKQAINDYCNKMQGDEIVCFCTGCHAGLQAADKKATNFIELVFPPKS